MLEIEKSVEEFFLKNPQNDKNLNIAQSVTSTI
jgi:hypothetical protein